MGVDERAPGSQRLRTDIQKATVGLGLVFLVVGIFGFIPGFTTNYQSVQFAGHESDAMLLGYFQVSILHNIVHLLFGIAAMVMWRTPSASRNFLIGGGTIYLVLWLYGLIFGSNLPANFIPVNTADNWLHFGLGIVLLGLGLILSHSPRGAERPV
ncbi:DUF4383 domain-containing protein [Arthrobacter sp. ISL-30]|uniref:DUF4383 domain-containing protein n=1 Tax=Arthrobacter sp. ISL-30 TaxID=2819109 RepID=UPI001BEAC438|nr:DUF4383 domain-containing protein [Arthrobacter sp. ISL-30]MBT2514830.1 DUF4383 domain-containing protein [Arthrobacter sp. ISL-30]